MTPKGCAQRPRWPKSDGRGHESEIYAAAARILYETPYVEMTITAEDRRP
jgi:hypothetical protein